IEDLGSGSAKFSIRLSEEKVQVHLFCKKNGLQDYVIIDLQNSGEVNNGDGTFTYTHTRVGVYQAGDNIAARYYTYTPASGQVFYPGPTDVTWSAALIYGSTSSSSSSSSTASSSSQGAGTIGEIIIEDLGSGSAKFSLRLSEQKVQVHLFCKKNGLQDHVVIDLQNSGEVNNGDGTYTYTHTRVGVYQVGDNIAARYYTYTPASGQVFYPGPTDSTWSAVLVYGDGSSSTPAPSNSADTWSAGSGWTLTWADEFSSPTINTANWTHETGDWGWGNNEYQNYTTSLDNSFINEWDGNGMLVIKAIYNGEGVAVGNYTSARLKTQGKQYWQYGKVAARIQLPYGQGIWPAFWMLGENIGSVGWPKCGEIDIMEMVGGGAGKDDTSHGVVHWDNGGWTYEGAYSTLPSGILADDFHVFEIEWDSTQVVWKRDGVTFFSKNITSADMSEFHANFFILLNMAVGGNWPGYPDTTTVFPQYMYIDWVRVYSKN
ncbi:MAG: glycoside hydrolase family 16 protein, partial [Spirochaetes bacterium]|nr:glycoside hydrolase family 16 protein [Spirochaetota bacterium]